MSRATLVGTGLVNSWYLVGNVSGLLTIRYGQLLLAKLALFAGMLSLAAINRFWLVPSMSKAGADGGGSIWKGRFAPTSSPSKHWDCWLFRS